MFLAQFYLCAVYVVRCVYLELSVNPSTVLCLWVEQLLLLLLLTSCLLLVAIEMVEYWTVCMSVCFSIAGFVWMLDILCC